MSPQPENSGLRITAERLKNALTALGIPERDIADSPSANEPAYLLGILLALVETTLNRVDRAELLAMNNGFMDALSGFANGNPQLARQGWALLLQERINRTALTLGEAIDDGEGKMLEGVMGPSMLIAANMLAVVNRRNMDPELVAKAFNTAENNLETARQNLSKVRAIFRERAFPDL